MPRVRLEYGKGEQVRFISHLDMVKAFQRAIQRAGIPIAYSEGFNPHPQISFASALAVGVLSEREYIDIELKAEVGHAEVASRLAAALPSGIDIKASRTVPDNAAAMMAKVNRSVYRIYGVLSEPVAPEVVAEKITDFLTAEEINIVKRTKKGPRTKNIRPAIVDFRGIQSGMNLEFYLVTAMGGESNVRPEEVACAFRDRTGVPLDCESLVIRRTELYIDEEGKVISPMEI